MGQANNNWQWLRDAGKWVGNKLEDFSSWVGGLGKKFFEPERQAALEDQKDLMSTQLGLNKEAAEYGQSLQKEMIEYTSPAMQIQGQHPQTQELYYSTTRSVRLQQNYKEL